MYENRIIILLIDPHNPIFVCLSLLWWEKRLWFLNILLGTHGVVFLLRTRKTYVDHELDSYPY